MQMEGLSQVHQTSNENPVRELVGRYMGYASLGDNMSYYPTHETQNIGHQVPPIPQRIQRRHVRGRGVNVDQPNLGEQTSGISTSHISSPHTSRMSSPHTSHMSSPLQTSHMGSPHASRISSPHLSLSQSNPLGQSSQLVMPSYDMFSSPFDLGDIPSIQQDFLSPLLQMPFYPNVDTSTGFGFHQNQNTRPTRPQVVDGRDINFDLNKEGGVEDEDEDDEDDNDNEDVALTGSLPLAKRKGKRPNAGINDKWCGTHEGNKHIHD